MNKKLFLTIPLLCSTLLSSEKTLHSAIENIYNIYYFHSNALNQRLGDLKDYPLNHGIWLRSNFSEFATKATSNLSSSTLQALKAQGGYDYAFGTRSARDFLGFSIGYGHYWLNSSDLKDTLNSIEISLYNTYNQSDGFYLDTNFKYVFVMQKLKQLSCKTPYSHLVLGNMELGYKFVFSRIFFLQPLIQAGVGYATSLEYSLGAFSLSTSGSMPLYYRAGGYMGINYLGSIRGDFRWGIFFDGDRMFFSSPTLKSAIGEQTLNQRDNYRLALSVGTNIHAGENFRLYLGAQTSFFGTSNLNYGVNLGMRFIFGQPSRHQTPSYSPPPPKRNLSSVQENLRYEGDASIARVEERTHLSNEQVEERYQTQQKRNPVAVEDDIKYTKRQRYIKESGQWIDTKSHEQSYQDRTDYKMQRRDIDIIKAYNQRELERKYGK